MSKLSIGRRQFGLASFAGLLAGSLRPSSGLAAEPRIERIITVCTPMGQMKDWLPAETAGPVELSAQCASLQPFKEKLLYVTNLRSALTARGAGDGGHVLGQQASFTGAGFKIGADRFQTTKPSIDQLVAQKLGVESLVLGVANTSGQARISYKPAKAPGGESVAVTPQTNAQVAFDTFFKDVGLEEDELARKRALQESVLDLWTDDIARLNKQTGAEYRPVLDAHLEQVRALEKQLAGVDPSATCDPPMISEAADFYGKNAAANYPEIGRQMMDLIVAAFSCNVTRAASLCWDRAGSTIHHKWATNDSQQFHALTHDASVPENDASLRQIYTWQTEQFAFLLGKLDQIPDPDGGTMLDTTAIYWSQPLGNYTSHSGYNMRTLVAGGNNHFLGNRHLMMPGSNQGQRPLNDLLAELYYGCTGEQTMAFDDPEMSTANELSEVRI